MPYANSSADSQTSSELRGTLAAVRYHRDNFLIGTLDSGVAVKGTMLSPQVGLEYTFRGQWESHATWGEQFAFSEYSAAYPTDLAAVRWYLMENAKWIGPEVSKSLLEAFGEQTLAVCKDDPARVAREINGITERRAQEISAMLRNNQANEALQLELRKIVEGTKVHKRAVNQILELYGHQAPEVIRQNPYRLIDDIDGIGFATADQVAQRVGYAFDGAPRIRAGVLHALKEAAGAQGHTRVPYRELLDTCAECLSVDPAVFDGPTWKDLIAGAINELVADELVVKDGNFVCLAKLFNAELAIAAKLRLLARQLFAPGQPVFNGLADDQRDAVSRAVNAGVFVLTGAPGTGKTFTIKRILESFPQHKIALAAPTGKAAKRMREQTGREALTIHKLLEPEKIQEDAKGRVRFEFKRGHKLSIDADLIVLDEASMIDVPLMARFMDAVSPHTRVILVGDTYQLPAVGPGNVLGDIIASGLIPCAELAEIKRQDPGLIIQNCHRIKAGQDVECGNKSARDFFFFGRERPESIRETILELVSRRLPDSYKADPLRDIQVITPLREKTELGCKELNAQLQATLNRDSPEIRGVKFRIGDKVIQTKNRYELNIINGDIGRIADINTHAKVIIVQFDSPDRTVQLDLFNNDLELAYAITCHKFQGSESRIVVIPVHPCFGPLIFQRNWMYTAISRASEVCVLVGQRNELTNCIARDNQHRRHTGLQQMISS